MTDIVATLWRNAGGSPDALESLELTGTEPGLPSSFRVGAVAQATIAASALAAAQIHHDRGHHEHGGAMQRVSVDLDHACAEFRSEQFYRIDGAPPPDLWDRIAGAYRCGDGRWVRIHTNFAHHRDGVLRLLNCAYDKPAVQAALERWSAEDFETQATAQGLVVAMMRSFDEWDAHPQAAALRGLPLWDAVRIDDGVDAPPRPWPARGGGGGGGGGGGVRGVEGGAGGRAGERAGDAVSAQHARPLSGLRVLDLTRIIAGPVGTRALASHGADVLTVSAAHLPSIDAVTDTGRGKRACFVDLREPRGRDALARLVAGCDVFVQGYRPGALDARGFGPHELARLRPGIVAVSLSAYGHEGPWAGKRGFDSLVQTATGFNHAEASGFAHAEASASSRRSAGASAPGAHDLLAPRPLPCQVLDHGTGFLIAFVVAMTLRRQRAEGGSWHVRVSLAQTAQWLRGLGRIDADRAAVPAPPRDAHGGAWIETRPSAWGELSAVRPAARLALTPARYERPSSRLGTHAPRWWRASTGC